MNRKILIIFLVVIAIFVSYFLTAKIAEPRLSVPSHIGGFVHFPDKDSENVEVALITLSTEVSRDGCTTASDTKFNSTKKDRSLFITIEGFYAKGTGEYICSQAVQFSRANIPFNPKTVDEIFLHLKGENNHYRVVRFDNEYILEPAIIPNVTIYNDSHQIAKFETYKEKEREQKEKLIEKTEELKLCEEYSGKWLSKDIWNTGDACEFVYLPLYTINDSYPLSYEKYFDGDEPNELFYSEPEEVQREAIVAKKLSLILKERNRPYTPDYRYYMQYYDGDEPNEEFYRYSEYNREFIIESKNLFLSIEEDHEKEINVAKEYCMEAGGIFEQGIIDYKIGVDEFRYSVKPHWVIRCYIKSYGHNHFSGKLLNTTKEPTGTLYMVGGVTDALYTLNPKIGRATKAANLQPRRMNGIPSDIASIGNELYIIDQRSDALYTLNPTTGEATRVGSVFEFGVGEHSPRGLVSIGNTLYMVGDTNDALYTLNVETGEATKVGNAWVPVGLASIGNTLYMLGYYFLNTLNPTTGEETRIGNVSQFGVGEYSPRGLVSIGNTLYMVGGAADALYTLNIETGEATRVNDSVSQSGVADKFPRSIASIGNTLYTVGGTHDALYTVNPATGETTRVGGTIQFRAVWDLSAIAHIDKKLYVVDDTFDALYTINPTTGEATRVGFSIDFGVGETSPRGLASIGNTLYMVGNGSDALYTLNIETGEATRVGNVSQFGVGEWVPTGLTSIGNTLYMVGNTTNVLYALNIETGEATRVANISRFGVGEWVPTGLTSIGNTLYMVGPRGLYILNPTTGEATRVNDSVSQFGVGEQNPTGLVFIPANTE